MSQMTIHSSWYKPKYKYLGSKTYGKPAKRKLYIGFELEVEFPDCFYRNDALLNPALQSDWWYIKEEASLDPSGIEVVSHPMSYEWFLSHRFEIMEMMIALKKEYARVHNDCGLHIHLSRWSFTKKHLLKFQRFIYSNPTFIRKLANRPKYVLDKWAALDETEPEMIRKAKLSVVYADDDNKNTAVNLCHKNSVEIRIFKSSLDYHNVFRNIEFCLALWEYTRIKERPTLYGFKNWVHKNRRDFQNLYSFIGLYL